MVSFPTKSAPLQGYLLSPLLFLIYVNDLPKPHHRQSSKSQFTDDTALWATTKNVQFSAKLLRKGQRKLAKWCAKWRIKLYPKNPNVIIFSRSSLARNSEPILKLYGEKLKIYPQVKFLGVTFDSNNNKKRSHTQLDSRKQVIAFQDRVITINIKEARHPLK